MHFTKSFLKVFIFGLALFALSGCESIPGLKGQADTQVPRDEPLSDEEGVIFVPIPSPYNANARVPSQAKTEFAQAKKLMAEKKYKQAESQLLLMTNTYPELSGPYVNLGIVYSRLGQSEDAIKAYRFAIETNKTNTDAYSQLALEFREQGKFQEAKSVYLDALNVWPHDPHALRGLGILYDLYMGQLASALAQYKLLAKIVGPEDKKLKGWIIDLERRLPNERAPKKPAKKSSEKTETEVEAAALNRRQYNSQIFDVGAHA